MFLCVVVNLKVTKVNPVDTFGIVGKEPFTSGFDSAGIVEETGAIKFKISIRSYGILLSTCVC